MPTRSAIVVEANARTRLFMRPPRPFSVPAATELEALGDPRIARLGAGERGHGDRVLAKDGRPAHAELALDPVEHDAEEDVVPAIAVVHGDTRGMSQLLRAADR